MVFPDLLHFVVAIDGPAGAGKSTVARTLASRLAYTFLDTGALYRAVALVAQQQGIEWQDGARLGSLARELQVSLVQDGEHSRVLASGRDVTAAIRSPDISDGASRVSAFPEVRQALLEVQRRVARMSNVVAEGRDIGTIVFPSAQVKFFLVANLKTRAERRTLELAAMGRPARLEDVIEEIRQRDERDKKRAVAPLCRADDAVEIDSSGLAPAEVLDQMVAIVRERGG